MLFVVILSVILAILLSYYTIKIFVFGAEVFPFILIGFTFWGVFMIIPNMIAIYIAIKTVQLNKRLSVMISKYATTCNMKGEHLVLVRILANEILKV